MIQVDEKVVIKGSNVEILADFMALIGALYEAWCIDEDMEDDIFQEILTRAIDICVSDGGLEKREAAEVEHSDYLS